MELNLIVLSFMNIFGHKFVRMRMRDMGEEEYASRSRVRILCRRPLPADLLEINVENGIVSRRFRLFGVVAARRRLVVATAID